MIERIKGILLEKSPNGLVLMCGNFGIKVHTPLRLLSEFEIGEEVTLFTRLVLPPEGTPLLYGFKTSDERELFDLLLKVPKVGAKVALSILSHFSVKELETAVESGNAELLSAVPGLGKKLSQRLIVELKGKLGKSAEIPEEFFAALKSLGYSNREIVAVSKHLKFSGVSIEELVLQAIKLLSGNRLDGKQ